MTKFMVVSVIMMLCSCATTQQQSNPLAQASLTYQRMILGQKDLSKLTIKGPFQFNEQKNIVMRLSQSETIVVDTFLPDISDRSPVVLFQHGNYSRKESHVNHCRMLASWGLHCVVIDQPNHGEWLDNAKRLAEFVKLVYAWPKIISSHLEPSKIIVIGHSFGGSAAALAAANAAPVAGLILLDPAVVHKTVTKNLKNVHCPVFLIGSDRRVFETKQRTAFRNFIQGEFAEVSVVGATHDDAQDPSMFAQSNMGIDPFTSNSKRLVFNRMILSAAMSLGTTGSFESSWVSAKNLAQEKLLKLEILRY